MRCLERPGLSPLCFVERSRQLLYYMFRARTSFVWTAGIGKLCVGLLWYACDSLCDTKFDMLYAGCGLR